MEDDFLTICSKKRPIHRFFRNKSEPDQIKNEVLDQTIKDKEENWEKALLSSEILNVPSNTLAIAIISNFIIQDRWKIIVAQASVTALEMIILIGHMMMRVLIVLQSLS